MDFSSAFGHFDSNGIGVKGSVFGLPFGESDADIILIPVPWDATVSYHSGTSNGPLAILNASTQLDLETPSQPPPWKKGIWMASIDLNVKATNDKIRETVIPYISSLEQGEQPKDEKKTRQIINTATALLTQDIQDQCLKYLRQGKLVGIVGGDHSVSLSLLKALSSIHDNFGILQIDAHMDLRQAYQGFIHSHASIMYNALMIPIISKLVQVGVRDYCEQEKKLVLASNERVQVYYDEWIKAQLYEGTHWKSICQDIISQLPPKVYVSFDIDGLSADLCPNTGTPVPGGLSFYQAVFLLEQLKLSSREIIGFDLCEVAPNPHDREWNSNVGARILYRLCGLV